MTIAAVTGRKITIYGDGKQVRDVLHVDDLLNAYDAAIEKVEIAKGRVYNMGGGPNNVLAVWAEFEHCLKNYWERRSKLSAMIGAPVINASFMQTSTKPRMNWDGVPRSVCKRALSDYSVG